MLDWNKLDWFDEGYKCVRASVSMFLWFDVWQSGSEEGTDRWHVAINEASVTDVKSLEDGKALCERLLAALNGKGLVGREEMSTLREEIARELSLAISVDDTHYIAAFASGMKVLGDRVLEKWGADV